MDIFRKRQDDKTVSLNEKVRLAEKDEEIAREKAREQERKERKVPAEKVYEITLKQAEQPGLPKPLEQTNSVAKAGSASKGITGAATNAPLASASQPAPVTPEDAVDEDKPPAVDAPLNESENILVDYLSVFPKAVLAQHTTDPR